MQQTPIFLQLSFIALQSMQSLCLILLDFKEVLVIIVVTLLSDPYNIWSIGVFQDLCNRTRNVCFYLVTSQSILFVVDLVLTLPSFRMAQSE